MVLLIDNYDSFSYNLYQLIGSLIDKKDSIKVIRNDEFTPEETEKLNPTHIVISPGPGRPADAGYCIDIIKRLNGKTNILGVCLGHQAICEAMGGKVVYAKELMHGKQTEAKILDKEGIFKGLPDEIKVARYHSLAVEEESLPSCLNITGISENKEIMSVAHENNMTFGLQFHPESIMTPEGNRIMTNFLNL